MFSELWSRMTSLIAIVRSYLDLVKHLMKLDDNPDRSQFGIVV